MGYCMLEVVRTPLLVRDCSLHGGVGVRWASG